MAHKDRMDAAGVAILLGLTLLFAVNQITIKMVNEGFNPVFGAAMRSVVATVCVLLWMRSRGMAVRIAPGTLGTGLGMGALFAVEFLCLYLALDYTTVPRASVITYSMPVWFALGAHFVIPGERLNRLKSLGLALAFAGMAGAILDQDSMPQGEATLIGDLLALGGAVSWAVLVLVARNAGPKGVTPEMQLLWMVAVSAPLLICAAPAFGPLLRDPGLTEIALLGFQGAIVVAGGFVVWFWMLSVYPAAGVASFSFLSPIAGMALGWAVLGDPVSANLLIAGAMVAAGLMLVIWPTRAKPA